MNEKGFTTISVIYLSIILIFITYIFIGIASIFYNQNLTQNSADQISLKLAITKDCTSLEDVLQVSNSILEKCEVNENDVKVKVKRIINANFSNYLMKFGINLSEFTAISRAS